MSKFYYTHNTVLPVLAFLFLYNSTYFSVIYITGDNSTVQDCLKNVARTRWSIFYVGHFQTHFIEVKAMYLDINLSVILPFVSLESTSALFLFMVQLRWRISMSIMAGNKIRKCFRRVRTTLLLCLLQSFVSIELSEFEEPNNTSNKNVIKNR